MHTLGERSVVKEGEGMCTSCEIWWKNDLRADEQEYLADLQARSVRCV